MEVLKMVASLLLNKENFDDGMKDAENKASSFGEKLGGIGQTAGAAFSVMAAGVIKTGETLFKAGDYLFTMTSNVAAYGDEVDEMSKKLGVSTDAYQYWNKVLESNGTSMRAMSGAFKNMNKIITGATAEQIAAFEKLGLSEEEVAAMNPEDLFGELIIRLQNITDPVKQASLAMDLFGASGQQLGPVLQMSNQELSEFMQQTQMLGTVMEKDAVQDAAKFSDSLDMLNSAVDGVKMSLVSGFMPGISQVMDGLALMISGNGGLKEINDGVTTFVKSLTEQAPEMANIASNIISTLLEALNTNAPDLIEAGLNAIVTIGMGILQNLPMLVQTAFTIINSLVQGIVQQLPLLIPACVAILADVVRVLTDPANLELLIAGALQLIVALAEGLINSIPELIRVIPDIIKNLVQALIAEIPQLLACAVELIVALAMGLIEAIPELITAIPEIMMAIVGGLMDGIGDIIETGGELIKGLWEGIKGQAEFVWEKLKEWWNGLLDKFKSLLGIHSPSTVFSGLGENLVKGLWEGISAAADWLWQKVSGWVSGLIDGIMGIFGIHSPSTVFAGIGKNMALGMGEGWEDTFSSIKKSIDDSLDFENSLSMSVNRPTLALAGVSSFPQQQNSTAEIRELIRSMQGMKVVMDTGETVGALATPMDGRLGSQYTYRKRGIL